MRTTIAKAHRSILRREDFDAGNMTGERVGFFLPSTYGAWLSQSWRDKYRADEPVYVVFSYGTPIFWVAKDGREVMPVTFYSTSTRRHQASCVRAMSWNPWRQLREPAPYELEVA